MIDYLAMAVLERRGFTEPAAAAVVENENLFDLLQKMNKIEGLDEADEAEIKAAGETVQARLNENPEIAGTLERQLQDDPALKGRVLDMVRNDPAGLNAKIPHMLDNPEQAAAILDGQLLPEVAATEVTTVAAETETAVSVSSDTQENDAASARAVPQQEETVSSQQTRADPMTVAASATGAAAEEAKGPEALKENFNWQAGTAINQTVDREIETGVSVQANPQEIQTENTQEQVAEAVSNSAETTVVENTGVEEIPAERQMIESMKFMLAQPGGEEFFEKIKENPELSEALNNAMGGENADPERFLAMMNQLKVRAENDPEFFNKANNFIEERPGMVQIFAETFANDPDKAFAQLDQALALDNAMGGVEKLLSRFLGPELSGQIMGFMDNLLEMFMPIMSVMNDFKSALSGEGNDITGQSNNGGELARDAAAMAGNDGSNLAMHNENGRPEQTADGQTPDERDPDQKVTATAPGLGQ